MAAMDPSLWREMMRYMRQKHPSVCRQWFDELRPAGIDSGLMRILTASSVQQNYLQKKCVELFQESAQAVTGKLVAVRFVNSEDDGLVALDPPPAQVQAQAGVAGAAVAAGQEASAGAMAGHGSELDESAMDVSKEAPLTSSRQTFDQPIISPDYSFENFVTGPENRLAYAAAVAVANQPGTAYNPLFIHGGVGLGKTHLLQATCQKILEDAPKTRICYLSCDAFITDYVECVQRGTMNEFRQRYRKVDVLVIDDVHFLADRERTQEEFFHTFNELHQLKRQIVLSSDSPPEDIPALEERLASRFKWGLVASVSRPSYETRLAIIRAKSKLRGVEMPEDVMGYIASRIDTNARELEGAITTIQGYGALQNRQVDLQLAHEALGDHSYGRVEATQVSLQQIIDVVTEFYNVKLSDLQSKRRHKSITLPRQVCMFLARRLTRFSLQEIGGSFGGRDHTTVMHSINTVEDRIDTDPEFAEQMKELEDRVSHAPVNN